MRGTPGPGERFAGYVIGGVIGRGGMGIVYEAEHVALNRQVAVKIVAPELATDLTFRERFLREARLAAALEHPAIIPIYDAGRSTASCTSRCGGSTARTCRRRSGR